MQPQTPLFTACLVLLLLFNQTIYGQTVLPPPGKVDLSEMNMKQCSFDTSAGAMYLLNSQETEVEVMNNGSYWTTTKRHVRLKIFNQKGVKYASVKFPIRTGRHRKLSDITGYIHYTDSTGQIVSQKITKQDIFKEKAEAGVTSLAFTFPNVKPGCIIEYAYTHLEKYSISIPPWLFQNEIPTALAFCKVIIPWPRNLEHKVISQVPIDAQEENKDFRSGKSVKIRTYSAKNIPAFEPEPLMGTWTDNLQRVQLSMNMYSMFVFSSLKEDEQWKPINKFFYKISEEYSKLKLAGSDTLIAAAKKIPGTAGKVNYLFTNLKKILKWDEDQAIFSDELQNAWKTKTGNSAEMNFILLNLLRTAGVPCSPILISTRDHGKVDGSFVNLGQFNGLDVLVTDSTNTFVLDLTQKHLAYNITPYNVINTTALMIDSMSGKWINIADARPLFKQAFLVFSELDSNGKVAGSAVIEHFDFAKAIRLEKKEEDEDEDETEKKDYKSFQEELSDIVIKNDTMQQPASDELPLVQKYDFELQLTPANNFYLLNPAFLMQFRKNPFTSDKRSFDIELGSNQSLLITLNMMLPENFTVDQLPKNITLIKSDSSVIFRRRSAVYGNNLQCQIRLEYLENHFPKEDYPDVKEFFTRMYGLLNEPVVLKRKD